METRTDECQHTVTDKYWDDVTSYGIQHPFYKRKCRLCGIEQQWVQTVALDPFKGSAGWGKWSMVKR